MGLTTAVRENGMRVIPFGLVLALGWLAIGLFAVWGEMDPFRGFGGEYIGHTAVSGYIGLLVVLITLIFGLYLYAEAGETAPGPERFPPR